MSPAEPGQRLDHPVGAASREGRRHTGGLDQGAGLAGMDLGELAGHEQTALGLEVEPLAADHAANPARGEQGPADGTAGARREAELLGGLAQRLDGHGNEEVADPGGDDGVEDDVGRQPAPPLGIVVHAAGRRAPASGCE
ncbi:MAG: hypothetical protein R2882_14920 [Gemmatimonadales bacterium]